MRQHLQYAYSISVLVGVLVCSFLMMDPESVNRLPMHIFSAPSLRMQAGASSPNMDSLFQVEEALSTKIRKDKEEQEKRLPTQVQPY